VSRIRCIISDYGGVLTAPIGHSWRIWARNEGLDIELFERVMADLWVGGKDEALGTGLELGTVSQPELERYLAERLRYADSSPVLPHGLIDRLWAALRGEPDMVGVLRRAKRSGYLVALLSNSWGMGYDRTGWDELFDAVVLSGDIGMRKPEPEIYRHVAELLQVEPPECVFIDDLSANVRGAAAVGMVGIHHIGVDTTIAELEALLGGQLR
jgi:putative hydrolase of the HAD superfamily